RVATQRQRLVSPGRRKPGSCPGRGRRRRIVTADDVKALLGLRLLEREGGWFAETYRAPAQVSAGTAGAVRAGLGAAAVPGSGERSIATAIYYLLTPGACSALHR